MKSSKAFLITPKDMFEKLKYEFRDFKQNPKSKRHAINFVLTAHHLKEWVWKSYLKNNNQIKSKISIHSINSKSDYYSLINSECAEIKLIRELANNIKHFYSQTNNIQETTHTKPWEEISCTWENLKIPWGYEGLIIINKENHWLSLLDIFTAVYDYWATQFETYFSKL